MKPEIETLLGAELISQEAPGVSAQLHQHISTSLGIHQHDFFELGIVRSGVGLHISPTGEFPIRRGNVFLLIPGEKHSFRDRHGMEIYCVIYSPKHLLWDLRKMQQDPNYQFFFDTQSISRFNCFLQLEEQDMLKTENLIREMEMESRHQLSGWKFAVTANFTKLLLLLSRMGMSGIAAQREPQRLLAILKYLDSHVTHSITVENLARTFGFSVRSLERFFKRTLHCSPVKYIARQRLALAAARLRENPEKSISEIAAESGFADSNYFCKCFAKAYGISPGRYRQ
jgi:AraC-like DNA-binding protein